MTNQTIDVTKLTPEQIKQIQVAIEAFRNINNSQSILTEKQLVEFDPTPFFFESEILQTFNRSLLYADIRCRIA